MKTILSIFFILFLFPPLFLHSEGEQEGSDYKKSREKMVNSQIQTRGIKDPGVLEAMSIVPRHLFMPVNVRSQAYEDHPVPIGEGQTISQPYVVALMTEALKLTENDCVLEIGTGSGYQAAILAMIVKNVYTIEIKELLYKKATETLAAIGSTNIKTLYGDGYFGWEEYAPFDCIMITAAVNHIPIPLFNQLKDGGRMILPLGNPFSFQELVLITKNGEEYTINRICGVLFVPMTGTAMEKKDQ
ncbi:MAG: protein-L-isoaspartate(D-aspartate) O-methyltransferase [Spirochaetales bacterium]|nr:protein-L-isoaspartate(D-aspartate) O-methyltransferase [Spirochaetales bacterium]